MIYIRTLEYAADNSGLLLSVNNEVMRRYFTNVPPSNDSNLVIDLSNCCTRRLFKRVLSHLFEEIPTKPGYLLPIHKVIIETQRAINVSASVAAEAKSS